MPFNLGGPELLIILVVVLIIFGAGKLPTTMRDLGRGVREFKKVQDEPDNSPASATFDPVMGPPASSLARSAASADTRRTMEPAPRA